MAKDLNNTVRKSGILLHPTSLPDCDGIGSFGKSAFDFIDFLSESNIGLWQILPLGPTGYGDSPYQSFSTFALNPLLIDFNDLSQRGWMDSLDALPPDYIKDTDKVDYGSVVWWKKQVYTRAAFYFLTHCESSDIDGFKNFCLKNDFWLRDYALFTSIKEYYDYAAFTESEKTGKSVNGIWNRYWPEELKKHDEEALLKWAGEHSESILTCKVIQYFAYTQWQAIHDYASSKNIGIIGDIPIFVSEDSCDVWANQEYFILDKKSIPSKIAGVPPDYFSSTGQLWGNPLYDWKKMKADGYKWWINRIRYMASITDYVRIDHFRGFESFWAVTNGAKDATGGKWVKGPGIDLFNAIKSELGSLPLIAEDLGLITDKVKALRDKCNLPGMKILQFAFSTGEAQTEGMVNAYLPHNYPENCVVYTGTHDNDTIQGYLNSIGDDELCLIASYIKGYSVSSDEARHLRETGELCHFLIREAFASVARTAVVPMQDILKLGEEARMNKPATSGANWQWRLKSGIFKDGSLTDTAKWLRDLNRLYLRGNK